MNEISVGANKHVQDFLTKHGSSSLGTAATLAELIRRPELSYEALEELDTGRQEAYRVLLGVDTTDKITLDNEVVEQINIAIKYDGYISRQKQQVEHFQKMEKNRFQMTSIMTMLQIFEKRRGRSYQISDRLRSDRRHVSLVYRQQMCRC